MLSIALEFLIFRSRQEALIRLHSERRLCPPMAPWFCVILSCFRLLFFSSWPASQDLLLWNTSCVPQRKPPEKSADTVAELCLPRLQLAPGCFLCHLSHTGDSTVAAPWLGCAAGWFLYLKCPFWTWGNWEAFSQLYCESPSENHSLHSSWLLRLFFWPFETHFSFLKNTSPCAL